MRIFRRSKQDPFALSPQEEREIRLRNVQAAFARVDLARLQLQPDCHSSIH